MSRIESGNITTDFHYNAKNNESKITKEVTDIQEPPQQNNEDNEGLRNEDSSNALESTSKHNVDRDNSSIFALYRYKYCINIFHQNKTARLKQEDRNAKTLTNKFCE